MQQDSRRGPDDPCGYLRRKPTSGRLSRYGGWLPAQPAVYREFLKSQRQLGRQRRRAAVEHVAAVAQFEKAIRSDPVMSQLMDQVFLQVAKVPGFDNIDNFEELLHTMDGIVTTAPKFQVVKDEDGNTVGDSVGCPLYLLLDLPSNTSAGYDLFRMPAFNKVMGDVLNEWGRYLTTPDSGNVLNETEEGWFSPLSLAGLEKGRGRFNSTYVCPEPDSPNRGFTSWDAFFTRAFQPSARPVIASHDKSIIHNACESTVYAISRNVKKHDRFWLKAQPYSLYDMLDQNDEDAEMFVGGTVFQAYLSPEDYHRWHAPVDGVITKTVLVPGAYYAALPDEGAEEDDPDLKPGDPHGASTRSQGWLTVASVRALVFIKADNPDIGMVCFIGVGMSEVSTCETTVRPGDRVKTGDQLGMFHFGGSSHALIFPAHAKITFANAVQPDKHLWVNSVLAQVKKE
ncbi:phosphatidylserine decarboxylase [Coprinopsis cinerea okayama7|uniref:Phosphatidylserine decarboxylase n=1 Tax=Coprinopsis cinerea (strain Okayama-7 / 130 / ATCC MYA-4618 / FGSC 9003) TaxID=240176 RepID=A8P4X2_COPC7|nr:phosphatidylserine decarboxylase [Coprinopsis cinerea okayama7\|eukprot:XP_001838831.1 phosphatidylserine decarboxylase [Coprinopsis cinerea okayama7\